MGTILRTGCVAVVLLGVLCGTAAANIRAGDQNPDLVVTASIGPNHLDVGERSVWTVTVTNTTSHAIRIRAEVAVETPFSDEGEGIFGSLAAGQSITEQHSFRAREGGSYTVTVKARDKNGASHARASAVAQIV